MRKNDKKAFTLIELIAVLVILAVIAIIVTPLVLNIIKSAKKSANERSVDEYGKAVELAAASYLLDTGKKANSFDVLNVEYSGNEVKCNVSEVYKNNVFLSQCSVNGKEVKNAKTSDGYYHYGDATKFVDMYGEAVKKAIVRYQKDNNEMPSLLSQLSINADGLNVSCNSSKINSDTTVYLSNCSLQNFLLTDNRNNDGYYHYGEAKYFIGDKVDYNGMNFYVISDSDENSDSVTMLKAEPLSVEEVNTYGKDHLNRYTDFSVGTATNQNGYGGMAYYSSETCGYVNSSWVETGCTTDYAQSEVKYAVDAWAKDKFKSSDLSVDATGYSARLITLDELVNNLGCSYNGSLYSCSNSIYEEKIYTSYGKGYWTMTATSYSSSAFLANYYDDTAVCGYGIYFAFSVRPVINLKKSVLESNRVGVLK